MLNDKKYNLPADTISEINAQVLTMLATGTDYPFTEKPFRDFASSIHNLVDLSIQLGKEGVAVRSEILRDELAKRGIQAPDGDFIYFGGRCIPTPTMFIPKPSREGVADKMADEIIDSLYTVEECDINTVIDTLISSAALDDVLLSMRTQAMVRKFNEKYPDKKLNVYIGNAVLLPDGKLLLLHYLNSYDLDMLCEDDDDDDDGYTFSV